VNNQETELNTPIYKILLLSSFFLFLFFITLFLIIKNANNKLSEYYSSLEKSEDIYFGILTEYNQVVQNSHTRHIFTYNVADSNGEIHEITESVDNNSSYKMRVGDTVAVKKQLIELFGKTRMISRIAINTLPYPLFSFLENLSLAGIVFSLLLGLLGFLKLVRA